VTDQLGLDLGPEPTGRVAVAVAGAIAAARTAGALTDLDLGAAALALALARGVDEAEARRSTRGRADCSKELRAVLAALGLDRASRGELDGKAGDGGDPFDDLTRAMSAAASDPAPP
jgi:hypothetical protein